MVKAGIATMGTVGSKCSNCTKCECATSGIRKISIECNAGAKQGILNVKSSTCSASGRSVCSAGPSTSAGRSACTGRSACSTCPSTSAGRSACSSASAGGAGTGSGSSRKRTGRVVEVITLSSSSESSSSEEEDVQVISERIKSKRRSPRTYYEKNKPTRCSNVQIRSRIFESRNEFLGHVSVDNRKTGNGKEIVTRDGARRNTSDNHRGVMGRITNKGTATLSGERGDEWGGLPVCKYRRMDTLKWTSRYAKEN